MKVISVIFSLLVFSCYSQGDSKGNYLMINNWSISFIQLNKDNTANWYTSGCTDQGTEDVGNWIQKDDTVMVTIDSKTTVFLLRKKTLCHLDETGKLTEVKYGIPKTSIISKWRIHNKAKRIRRRK